MTTRTPALASRPNRSATCGCHATRKLADAYRVLGVPRTTSGSAFPAATTMASRDDSHSSGVGGLPAAVSGA